MTPRRVLAGATAFSLGIGVHDARAEASEQPETTQAVDVALVWIFGDDDVANAPNARVPPSPGGNVGDRPGYDALEPGYTSRYTGRENRLELRLHGSASGFVPSLGTDAEVALGVDLDELGERGDGAVGAPLRVEDVGSFVEARLALAPECVNCDRTQEPVLGVRLYPINGDLERVGWLEALGWGGATGPERESPYATATSPVRGGRAWLFLPPVEIFAGLKTATFIEPVQNAPAVEETSYGVFAGIEAEPSWLLALGIAGGYFEHGLLEAARGERATTAGGSARVSLRHGMDEARSPVAFLGRGDDPFRWTEEPPHGSFVLGVEVAALVQRLGDFDRPGETRLVPARAVSLSGGARLGPFETSGALLLRDPEFVMRNVPGVFPGQSVPGTAERDIERTLLVSNGVVFSPLVRADLALGLRFPAAVMTAALDRLGQPTGATIVLNTADDVELLPAGAVPVPILDARLAIETRLSSLLSGVAWTQYRRDYNRTRLVPVAGEAVARGFAEPDRFGYGVALRATW